MSKSGIPVVSTVKAALDWLASVQQSSAPKLIAGPRGGGKTVALKNWRKRLIETGVPEDDTLFIDAESPDVTRMLSPDAFLEYVLSRTDAERTSYIFIANVAALPNAETALALLFAQRRYEVIATSSVRHIANGILGKYLSDTAHIAEFLPRELGSPDEVLWATWDSMIAGDVFSAGRQVDLYVLNRIAQYLSDHLGDRMSLREIASALSFDRMTVSPTTVSSYIDALVDAYIVEQVARISRETAKPSKIGSLYLFLRPKLRLAKFGPAPEDEEARVAKNEDWLKLRQHSVKVYVDSADGKDFFVTRR